MNKIIYITVAKDLQTFLCEYTAVEGDYKGIVKSITKRVTDSWTRRSFNHEGYAFQVLRDDKYTYLLMCGSDIKLRVSFACLEDVKDTFRVQFTEDEITAATSYGLQNDFSKVLRHKLEIYNSPDSDKLNMVRQNMEQTKDIMRENLDQILERGEKIEIILQKTEQMVTVSTDMKKQAVHIRREMWWRNRKIQFFAFFALIILLIILLIIIIAKTS